MAPYNNIGEPQVEKAGTFSAAPPAFTAKPIMRQIWRDLTFIHWRYDASLLRPLIPRQLELDSWQGECWVGLIPFRIAGLALPRGPAIPWLSSFPETNVRTYVIDSSGRRGVWFFSLDAARLLGVLTARIVYGLPYFWAKMSMKIDETSAHYRSRRIFDRAAQSDIRIEIGETITAPDDLTAFLTARFCLYAQRSGRLVKAEIHHNAWPLQKARITHLQQNLIQAAGLPAPQGEPLVHFSRRVDVLAGKPEISDNKLR